MRRVQYENTPVKRGLSLFIAALMVMSMAGSVWADLFGFFQTEKDKTAFTEGMLEAYSGDLGVHIAYGPEAEIPEGAVVDAYEFEEDSAEYNRYLLAAENALTSEGPEKEIVSARFFDLTITDAEGNSLEPKSAVEVRFDVKGLDPKNEISVVHFPAALAEEGADLQVE